MEERAMEMVEKSKITWNEMKLKTSSQGNAFDKRVLDAFSHPYKRLIKNTVSKQCIWQQEACFSLLR